MAEKTFVLYFLMHIWYNKNMNKDRIFQCDNEVTHGRGYVYSLKYHIVWCTKYRKQIFVNDLESVAAGYIKETAESLDMELIAIEIMPDHVHLLLSIPPKTSVSSFMGYLKGKSALMMFDKHANLKYKFGNRHFWAEGYYVSTVGLNESTIKKYIQDQEKADIALDKLSVKEYADPFS